MIIAISVLAIVMLLSIGALGAFAMLVIAIRRDDRDKHLTRAPRTRMEATTRRVLGIHSGNASSHHDQRS